MHPKAAAVADHVSASLDAAIARLGEYVRFPAISCEPAHAKDVRALAERVKDDLAKAGLDRSRLHEIDGAHPCVAAEWLDAPGKPTVLIYGHFDVQPVKGEVWNTPPHELVRKGDRVYGRGSADDMGGWVSHLVAIEAWLKIAGALPCNVKLLIEGEEEIGSPNLERFMDAFPDAFAADAMILTDCENPSVDTPGLTTSLRGLLEVDVTCKSSASDVHSGLWGNIVPDPQLVVVKLVARLIDDDGRMKLGRRPVDAAWMEQTRPVSPSRDTVQKGAHLLPGVEPLPERGQSAASWGWRQPALTVLSTTFPVPGSEKNAIRAQASMRLSIRIPPGGTREELLALVTSELTKDVPGNLQVTITEHGGASSAWDYVPQGPAFEAADRAYQKAWGKPLTRVGVGGSIPFVALFGQRFSHLPLILNGVIDPQTTAHGPNESMHVGVFAKAMLANVHLLDELADVKLGR